MSFIMPKGAREFFKNVEKQREGTTKWLMFDEYYCCLMAGLDARRCGNEEDLGADVFLNDYPDAYKSQADIIAGLLIDAELDRKGVAATDRATIEKEIVNLLDPSSATRLNIDGNKLLNQYAAEGFKLVQGDMLPPNTLEDFLVAYRGYWHSPDNETV